MENTDNLISDINGKPNLAGAGINTAQRIMDKADAGQILVSSSVFETVLHREKYMGKFRSYSAQAKHLQTLELHQYIAENLPGLNVGVPSTFAPKTESEPKLSKFAAYYFAHAIKLRGFLATCDINSYPKILLLWFLALDSVDSSEATDLNPFESKLKHICNGTTLDQLNFLNNLPFWITTVFAELVGTSPEISPWVFKYFEGLYGEPLFVSAAGKEKLLKEWPSVLKELELS